MRTTVVRSLAAVGLFECVGIVGMCLPAKIAATLGLPEQFGGTAFLLGVLALGAVHVIAARNQVRFASVVWNFTAISVAQVLLVAGLLVMSATGTVLDTKSGTNISTFVTIYAAFTMAILPLMTGLCAAWMTIAALTSDPESFLS